MANALERVLQAAPPILDRSDLWVEAISGAARAPAARSGGRDGESPAARMKRLREQLDKEIVAFHDRLTVKQAGGPSRWEVGIPLTLFPCRDHGFSRVECYVEFAGGDEGNPFRIVSIAPENRTEVLARAETKASLDLTTSARAGLPESVLPAGITSGEAAVEIYGKAEAGLFNYEARRQCVQAEIVRGNAARWRLDDLHDKEKVFAESHRLQVVLEVEPDAGPISAAGYLQAYSTTKWLTHAVGSIWRDLGRAVKSFFQRGAPAEAYGEWQDILA